MPPPPYPPPVKPEDFTDKLDEPFAGTPPEARLARFAASLSAKHHNTLVPSAYGVVWLQLEAGSASSKSFGGTESKEGREDFHYASGVEDLTLKYKINDPKGVIRAARLELFRRFDETPLWKRDLTDDERTDGEHSFKFELGADPNPNFPDLVPTAEHSPYKLKITTSAKVRPQSPCAWTFFQVLVHDVTLELGDRKVLPKDAAAVGDIVPGSHRSLYDTLGGKVPKESEKQKLELLGNLFKTASAQMYDNSAFDHHETQWGDGSLIPIFARLRVRKSDDTPVDAPLALGNVKCLWDWVDVPEDTSGLSAKPALYVGRSINYDRGLTKPRGDNCHEFHGGKRDDTGTDHPVFPPQAGYDPKATLDEEIFPFKVEAATKRTWAALSLPWRKELLVNKTGVLFQPSRMAGDLYTLACYVAWEKDKDGNLVLDVEDELKDKTSLKAVTGKFEIWRKHEVVRYLKKKAFAHQIKMADVQTMYGRASVNLHKAYASIESMPAAGYNTTVANTVATFDVFGKSAVDSTVNQHATGDCGVTFRGYDNYKTVLRGALGMNNAQFNTWLAGSGAALNTADKYAGFCKNWAKTILTAVCASLMPAGKGLTICQFIHVHNMGGGLLGFAPAVSAPERQRAGLIVCDASDSYTGTQDSTEQTTAHELGHILYMPHAPDSVPAGAGPAPDMHDKDDHACLMSYVSSTKLSWCGLCTLRLRGWDKSDLDKDGTKNTHP